MQQPTAAALALGSPGTMSDVRRRNLSLVLTRIVQSSSNSHPSRAQIAFALGLSKASVSSLVLELLSVCLAHEVGLSSEGQRGRPGIGLELNFSQAVMVMEIKVAYIVAGIVDLSGTLLIHEVEERDSSGSSSEQVMIALASLAALARSVAEANGDRFSGVGWPFPG